jgi:hypothetical protein
LSGSSANGWCVRRLVEPPQRLAARVLHSDEGNASTTRLLSPALCSFLVLC